MIDGHCSKCHKVWALETEQGLCRWCGKFATSQTSRTQALRSIKSSGKRRQRQAEHNGNGYDQLDGEWATYHKVASHFSHRTKAQDREDLLQDIMITLYQVAHHNGDKPMSEAMMYRIASHAQADYWRKHYKLTNGLSCGGCSQKQRAKCREDWLYGDCPKSVKLESLSC